MGIKILRGLGFFLSFIVISLFTFTFVAAGFEDCWVNTGDESACDLASGCVWQSAEEDPWCNDEVGCCLEESCWIYEGNESACISITDSMNCTWDPFMTFYYENGSVEMVGACFDEFSLGGEVDFAEGCWQNDGDIGSCTTGENQGKCSWSENNANQNPWCGISSLTDAQMKNPLATILDVGCCEQKGCWSYDNNESSCMAAFEGNCVYENNSYGGGWCNTKWCGEITDETNCSYAQQNLYMPCEWNSEGDGSCQEMDGGGFDFYNDDKDSCFDNGGWYNSTGTCIMPSGDDFSDGSGGFMFGGEAHCWFADNNPNVCGNIAGCAYCSETGVNGIANISSENICSGAVVGYCEGHVLGGSITYDNANNSANLACADIGIKTACNYGPLPNCKWTNSSVAIGSYCESGASAEKKSAPPVQYCEDPLAKNNYTLCTQLSEQYMMPCKWDNSSYPVKNCTFNNNAVFGSDGGEKDFEVINNQFSCTSAGGTWQSEFYVDGDILKEDSWCEMTGMFDIDTGAGQNNKMNCDTSCWACEFQSNGSVWANVDVAENACVGSALGYCEWVNDTSGAASFNGLGWCDYPKEMESGGAQDCDSECEGCNFMNDPEAACNSSVANAGVGCKWVSEGANDFCVDKTKKVCSTDCFSCYDDTSCYESSTSCAWDSEFGLCSPQGFEGEICFDGVDNDNDNMIDCSDPDCGFDNFCGGSSFGGDCFAQATQATCNQTFAFELNGENLNCSWITDDWNTDGWCDMPGSNCWTFDNDMAACGAAAGCTNDSSSMGMESMCDLNKTKMDTANCWQYEGNESTCNGDSQCQWVEDEDSIQNGWCDYKPFASCMGLGEDVCGSNSNCTWNSDEYSMQGGWCDVACFDWTLDSAGCAEAAGGICEWRNMSSTCQPEMFMMFGGGIDGEKTGCWQYDGNETGCALNSVTCQYKNDSFSNNNLSVSEPAGWCMDKAEYEHFGEMEGDVIDLAFDSGNDMGEAEAGVSAWVDLMGMGMRVTDNGFNFGAGVYNISDGVICNGYMVGTGPEQEPSEGVGGETSEFYWYLDTDGISTGGCEAVQATGDNLAGFDFMINYVSRNTTSDGILETKQLMRCSFGNWIPTNALVTTTKKMSCGEIGGVMIAISKQDLESFSEYNKTANLRVFMSSADNESSRVAPSDSIGPGYYTPGTIDFGFVDCSDPTMSKDPKCKNFQKFGFNVFEECKNGIDDDENGLVDCDDPFCIFVPNCLGDGETAFNFSAVDGDNTAPTVVFSEVEKLYDAAFVRVDTSESSNLSLGFYGNNSGCLIATLNATLLDTGSGYQENANFKPFHSVDLMESEIGYPLVNNTAYYYKITVCDPSGNCAVSECSNFTTKTSSVDKSFIFKMDLPDNYTVDIPALNKTDYNFSETFGGVDYDVGIKTNTSVTKNMNMTIHCGDMAIGFFGMNVLSPTKIDLSNAFVCDPDENLMGMNSSLKKWNKLIDELHLSGAADYIEITIPVAYDEDNVLNWTDDDGTDGEDVDDYVNCTDGGDSNTVCKVPVSMGFSAYTVSTPAAVVVADTSTNTGGSAPGGAAAPVVNTTSNETILDESGDSDVLGDNSSEDGVGDVSAEDAGEAGSFSNFLIWFGSIVVVLGIIGTLAYRKYKK